MAMGGPVVVFFKYLSGVLMGVWGHQGSTVIKAV